MVLQEPHANNGLGARDRAVALLGDASLHADHASDEYNFFASDEVDGRAANFLKNVDIDGDKIVSKSEFVTFASSKKFEGATALTANLAFAVEPSSIAISKPFSVAAPSAAKYLSNASFLITFWI